MGILEWLNTIYEKWYLGDRQYQLQEAPMDIIDLFKQRETHYEEDTETILKSLSPILDGVCEYVEVNRSDITIDRVLLLDTEEIGHVVLITISIPIRPEEIPPEIDREDTVLMDSLRHLVSVGIPANMANATKEDTVKYLRESKDREEKGLPITEDLEIAQAMAEKDEGTVH